MGDVAPLVRRPVEPVEDETYREIGIRSFGKGIFHKPPTTGVEIGSKRVFAIEPGDLLFNIVFAWEGAVAVAAGAERGMIGSHRFLTCVADQRHADAKFLSYWFQRGEGRAALQRASPGGAGRNRTLGVEKLAELTVPLPPITEQRRIVARIDALAVKVDEARVLRRAAVDAAKMLWQNTARERILALPNSIPRRRLDSLASMKGGGTPSKSEPRFWRREIPWITPKDMKRPKLSDAKLHISIEATRESSAKPIEPGAVLIVVRGMILAHTFPVAVLMKRAAINQDMKALIPCDDVNPEYLSTVLLALNRDMLELVDRSSHDTRKLVTEKLESFLLPVPSLAEQRRIVAELDALQDRVDAVRALQAETAAELDALMPAILDKSFKGEL